MASGTGACRSCLKVYQCCWTWAVGIGVGIGVGVGAGAGVGVGVGVGASAGVRAGVVTRVRHVSCQRGVDCVCCDFCGGCD